MYYKVSVKSGHVGTSQNDLLTFYIEAPNFKKAMDIAKSMPGVKHNNFSVLQSLKMIKQEEYEEGIKTSAYERKEI